MSEPGLLPKHLSLAPLERVSPSSFLSLRRCALRTAWSRLHSPLLPRWPAARVGTVVHQLLEQAGEGKIGKDETELEQAWKTLIRAQEKKMRDSWLEHHLLPLSDSVQDYHVRKYRALNLASEIGRLSRKEKQIKTECKVTREQRVQAEDGKVVGRIDLLLHTRQGIILRDYKTGSVLENSGSGKNQKIKERYHIQLKLYAALYHVQHGEWPIALEIAPMDGSARKIAFTHNECKALLEEARERLKDLNEQVEKTNAEKPDKASLDKLANPSPQVCRFCRFRPACPTYEEARKQSREESWPVDVMGEVAQVRKLDNGQLLIQVKSAFQMHQTVWCRGIDSDPRRHPGIEHVENRCVALYNLRQAASKTFKAASMTTIYAKRNPSP